MKQIVDGQASMQSLAELCKDSCWFIKFLKTLLFRQSDPKKDAEELSYQADRSRSNLPGDAKQALDEGELRTDTERPLNCLPCESSQQSESQNESVVVPAGSKTRVER